MKIISVANQKGGCGKTTSAINLASALGQNGKRVLLVDLDPQAHASLGLNIESQDSMYNVISKLTPRKLKITDIIHRVEDCFDIVPSNILVGTLEQELADEIGRELKLTEIMKPMRELYDYILIDCPPSLGILTVNSIRVSDEIIIPVETSRFSMQGVDHIMDIVKLVRDRLNHAVKCRILITMFDSRLRHSFSMLDTFRQKFKDLLFDTIVHTNVKLKESAVMGQTVSCFDKYCRGSKDYYTLSKEIISLERQEKEQEARTVFRSLSSRMQKMIEKETRQVIRDTKFAIKAPGAKAVYVTGSFNDWSLDDSCRLREASMGQWEIDIPLKAGQYEYQFIVDGVWKEDPSNPAQERNVYGDNNSVMDVKSEAQPVFERL
ncbi:MAG: AAA family ATPase [Candidatus Omnitrophica bacterium]|nr:AAA family ATPase [Candidatus Omnitrophota bacterium]